MEQSYGFAGLVQQPPHGLTRASFVSYPALPSWPHGHMMAAALPDITYTFQEGRKG